MRTTEGSPEMARSVRVLQRLFGATLLILLVLIASCAKGNHSTTHSGPAPALKSLDASGQMQISEQDRCPVCGMQISRHVKFASAIQLSDDSSFYFCGTGCMMKAWLHPEIFLDRDKQLLRRAVTPEYFEGHYVDAMAALWVAGSDVVGPMGPALVPLQDEADLETFKTRHGGKITFKLSELDDMKWKEITGKGATMRPGHKTMD